MPIEVECRACGTKMQAGDAAAGKRLTCSDCGTEITVPALESASDLFETSPSDVFEASPSGVSEHSSEKTLHADIESDDRERRPCPNCAELIIPTAATCRFCGFTLKNQKKGKKRRPKSGSNGADADIVRRFRREMVILGIISVLLSLIMFAAASNLSKKAEQAGPIIQQIFADLVGQLFLAAIVWMVVAVGAFLKKVWALWVCVIFDYFMVLFTLNFISNDNTKDKGFFVFILLMIAASLTLTHRSFSCVKKTEGILDQ
jgi:predicted RNA-binding Zn-ribbon protein involved in translation (DUF1610 family)